MLARPEGAGIENRPGTKGLSLFVVPKYLFDPETGELGERNGAFVTGVEHKMGLKVSTTCELSFGQHGVPAVGYLLGDRHDGIAQMFQVIEYARMMVGTKAIATLSTGYLNALDYAKQRVQSADLTRANDKTAPRVTIIHHPDVRRILMKQKAYAEGLRAVYLYTASWQDRIAAPSEVSRSAVRAVNRSRPSGSTTCCCRSSRASGPSGRTRTWRCRCRCSAGRATPRTTRSSSTSGTPRSTPCTRAPPRSRRRTSSSARSSRTTAPHWASWRPRSASSSRPPDPRRPTAGSRRSSPPLSTALDDVQIIVGRLVGYAMACDAEPASIYRVGEHAVSLLMSTGDLLIGYLLLRQAIGRAGGAGFGRRRRRDADFYTGKLAVARWFARNVLPELTARRA